MGPLKIPIECRRAAKVAVLGASATFGDHGEALGGAKS